MKLQNTNPCNGNTQTKTVKTIKACDFRFVFYVLCFVWVKNKKDSTRKIVLQVRMSNADNPLLVKVKPTTKWAKIMEAFARHSGREVGLLKFLYDGERIHADITPTVGEV